MITSALMLCGEDILRDAETNRISVFNILEQMSSQTFPMLIPKMAVLNILSRDTGDADEADLFLKFSCNNNELTKFPVRIRFGGKEKTRSIFRIDGLVVPEPGILEFRLSDDDGRMIGRYDMNISIIPDVTLTEIGEKNWKSE